jgi:TolB-like protein/tetratricopeptide (TPR) repeat protein
MSETALAEGPAKPGPIVFISYARADREQVARLTDALTAAGPQVWWDALIEGGEAFARTIESALDLADVVVVVWSATSVVSDWVRDEAAHGRDRGRLVPISIDGTAPPLGFRQYHVIDFSKWRASPGAPEMKALLSAIAAAATARGDAPRSGPGTAVRRGIGRRTLLIGAATGAAVAGTGFAGWRLIGHTGAPDNSIAVLPFANLSGDAAQGYFSDGLSEELRAKLGEAGGFKVAAKTSSDHFRNHDKDATAIGAQLGVAWLLDGSVRRSGSTVRISTELVDAQSGLSKWTKSYDRQLSDIFAVQSEIASTVIQEVTGAIPAATAALIKSGTTRIAAYDAYLKGRGFYSNDDGADADNKALASFDEAIAADPNYAQAHVMRAEALLDIAGSYAKLDQIPGLYAEALAAGQRALALAPDLASAHLVVGEEQLFARLDFRAAKPYFDKAMALGGHDSHVLGTFAYFAVRAGRIADALTAVDTMIDVDRLNAFAYLAKARCLYCARRHAEAIKQFGTALAMNPRMSHAHAGTGFALLAMGQIVAARDAFAAEPTDFLKSTGLAIAARRAGDAKAAEANLAKLKAGYGDAGLYQQALVAAQWGDVPLALALLERARVLIDGGLTWALTEPMFDPIRNQPRFKTLLAGMGLA